MFRRNTITKALTLALGLPEALLDRTLSSSEFSCKHILVHLSGPDESWYLSYRQSTEREPAFFEAVGSVAGAVRWLSVTTDEHLRDAFIHNLLEFLRTKSADADLLQALQFQEAEKMFKQAPVSALRVDDTIDAVLKRIRPVAINIIYKSERTTWLGRAYKILVLNVVDTEQGTNQVWGVIFHTETRTASPVEGRRVPSLVNPVFNRIMALYRSGQHEAILPELHNSSNAAWIRSCIQCSVDGTACICITPPKLDTDDEFYDDKVLPGHFYQLISEEKGMNNIVYYNVVGRDGVEISRRANHFIKVARS